MAVPNSQTLMLPLLKLIADGQKHASKDLAENLSVDFALSKEELRMRLPNGQTIFEYRIQRAKIHLAKATLLQMNSDDSISITDNGISFIHTNPFTLDLAMLKQMPAYKKTVRKEKERDEKRGLLGAAMVLVVFISIMGYFASSYLIQEHVYQKHLFTPLKNATNTAEKLLVINTFRSSYITQQNSHLSVTPYDVVSRLIEVSIPDSEPALIEAVSWIEETENQMGFIYLFLNSGNSVLEEYATTWARDNGFDIITKSSVEDPPRWHEQKKN